MDSKSILSEVNESVNAFNQSTNLASEPLNASDAVINDVFPAILKHICRVDFNSIANNADEKAATEKQKAVIAIEQLIKITADLNRLIKIEEGKILVYNSRYWQTLSPDETKNFLGKVAEKMGYDHYEARHYSQEGHLLKQLQASAWQQASYPPNDKILINVQNYTLEITADKIITREHRPEDNFRHCLSYDYLPDSKSPLFQKFLNEVLPDEECQRLLLEYLGYVFTKGLKFEKVLFLFGDGKNGKSVVYEIVRKFLGEENVSNFSLEELTNDKSYCRIRLQDVLLNYGSDINDKLHSDAFKKMASSEPILARAIYQQSEEIRDYAKQIYNTNHLPERGVDYSNGHFRRLLVIPFRVTIKDKDVDIHLAKKIYSAELSGILNLVLANLQTIIK
jgi:putative DNA primase/helicase